MKRKLIIIAIIGALLFILLWLSTHSFLEVQLENPSGNQEISYTLVEQRNQKTTEIKSSSPKVKRLVRKGSYEVLLQQNGQTYLSVTNTGGFLTSKTVSGKASPERSRKFIGNNPLPCMHLVSGVLLSIACGDTLNKLQVHVPATAATPTYTSTADNQIRGFVQGIVNTKEGPLALVRINPGDETEGPKHAVYGINNAGSLTDGTILTDLNPEEFYSLTPYNDGFVVYNPTGSEIFYYSSRQTRPTRLTTMEPNNKALELYALSVHDESILLTYSSSKVKESENLNFDDPEGLKAHSEEFEEEHDEGPEQSELIVYRGGASKRYTFDTSPAMARLCGIGKLCYLREGQLDVYNLGTDKQKLLFKLTGVNAIENAASGLLVARENGLLNFSVDTQAGFLAYSFGGYSYCGMQASTNDYVLCLNNSKNERVALYINHTESNKDSIDKKVAELLKLPQVKDLSVYDRFIYVSPETGELVYDQAAGGFVPDPATLAVANQAINQAVERLGIDRSVYTVINAFE